VNVLIGAVAVVAITSITVSLMLFVRRRAPAGSFFSDGDRASGVFGVLATGFSVLLGFIIVIAFQSYNDSLTGADAEAIVVAQQVETAQFLPADTAQQLTGHLICYARSVVGPEWDSLGAGTLGESVNPWGVQMYQTIKAADPQSATEQSAYDRWMEQTAERELARSARIYPADGLVPLPLWLVLMVIFGVILVYMLFFADPAERAVTQGLLMGSVTAIISMLLLLLVYFNNPYGEGVGRLSPTAMERTVRIIEEELTIVGLEVDLPCGPDGAAR
jgi:hypothetical protein